MNYNFLIEKYLVNELIFNGNNKFLFNIQKAKKINRKYLNNLAGYKVIFALTEYNHLTEYSYINLLDVEKKLKCIFCLRTIDETSFSQKAHVIPEFLGNRYLLHYEECDECNAYFSSSIEDALDKYTTIYRVFNRTKNKKNKLISYHSINQKSFGNFDAKDIKFKFVGYDSDFDIDVDKKIVTMNFDIPKHRPSNMYKAFAKIVYGLLPKEELKNFSLLRSWINNRDQDLKLISPLIAYRSIMPFFNHKPLNVIIMKKFSNEINYLIEKNISQEDMEYLGLISFGNVVFEFPVFSDHMIEKVKKIKNFKFNFKFMPKPYFSGNPLLLDLSSSDFKTDKLQIDFSFQNIVKKYTKIND